MTSSSGSSLIIAADRLFDGLSTSPRPGQAVLIEAGRLATVSPVPEVKRQAPPDTEVTDLGDACLTPGLIDCHTHVSLPACVGAQRTRPRQNRGTDPGRSRAGCGID